MPLYPKSFIQRLRDEAPVSQIIGARIPVKKKGREFEACCPFHQEKTPSFFINDQKGFYHCFGCSVHGDSLKFLMEYENLSYPQAIEALAREIGIPLPEISPEAEREEKKRASLQQLMAMSAAWYQQQLSLSGGHAARDYLRQRGLNEETIRLFELGFAPEDRTALKRYLLKEGATEDQLVECGMLIRLDSGETYDRFRGRLMFPIFDRDGDTIAFGGRLLAKSDTAPKYLNSPETPLFHKGRMLYNWNRARIALRDDEPLLVAEGYMDVIALHQYGFHAAVAPLGTALTETHLSGLWRYLDAPVLCLDGDNAGQRAMWRSAELALPLLQPGKSLRFLTLPQGQDPDDFLRASGAEALRQRLKQSAALSEVVYRTISQRHGSQTPEKRAAADAELDKLTQTIRHEGVRHHFRQYFREQAYAGNTGTNRKNYRGKQTGGGTILTITPPPGAPSRAEGILRAQQQMLKLLLAQPEILQQTEIVHSLGEISFVDNELSTLQHWLLEGQNEGEPRPTAAKTLLHDNRIVLPQKRMQHDAIVLWRQMVDGMTLAQIDEDIKLLQHDMTENNLNRIIALKAEKEALLLRQHA